MVWHAGALIPFSGAASLPASPAQQLLPQPASPLAARGVLPWTGARPMIPNPSVQPVGNADAVPEALQSAIAEVMQQPTQVRHSPGFSRKPMRRLLPARLPACLCVWKKLANAFSHT